MCVFTPLNWHSQISVHLPVFGASVSEERNYSLNQMSVTKDQTGFRVWSAETRLYRLTNNSANLKENSHLDTHLFIELLFNFFFPSVLFAWVSILRCLLNFLLLLPSWQNSLTSSWLTCPNTNSQHLSITYFVLGHGPLLWIYFSQLLRINTFLICLSQMRKLKPGEVK